MITQSLVALLLLPAVSTSFLVMPLVVHPAAVSSCRHLLFSSATDDVEIASMKLREIQAELKDRGVSYADCFDRESLTQRLREARSGTVSSSSSASSSSAETVKTTPDAKTGSQSAERTASSSSSFDRQAVIEELRSMRVAELRTECGNRNIRWANMVEKEDLVQALLKARELAASFSPNLVPGQVGSLTEAQLEQELATKSSTPLLLDVYATWCGPCQLMAPQLVQAAADLGNRVRVGKIDSDKYPDWSRKLRVQAFPTVLLFDGDGKEVERVEGALMKDQIKNLVGPYIA